MRLILGHLDALGVELLPVFCPEPARALPDRKKVTPSYSRRNHFLCSSDCNLRCIVQFLKYLVSEISRTGTQTC